MPQPVWTFEEVVQVLGGPTAVGRICGGHPASAVCNWGTSRNRFPPKYYIAIKCALEDKGYYAPLELFGFYGDFRKSA